MIYFCSKLVHKLKKCWVVSHMFFIEWNMWLGLGVWTVKWKTFNSLIGLTRVKLNVVFPKWLRIWLFFSRHYTFSQSALHKKLFFPACVAVRSKWCRECDETIQPNHNRPIQYSFHGGRFKLKKSEKSTNFTVATVTIALFIHAKISKNNGGHFNSLSEHHQRASDLGNLTGSFFGSVISDG